MMARTYEMVLVLSDKLGEQEIEKTLESVRTHVNSNGGAIVSESKWGRKKLAYQIERSTHGVYFLFLIEGNSEIVAILNRQFKITEAIVRHLIVSKDKHAPDLPSDFNPCDDEEEVNPRQGRGSFRRQQADAPSGDEAESAVA